VHGGFPPLPNLSGALTAVFWALALMSLVFGLEVPSRLVKNKKLARSPRGLLYIQVVEDLCIEAAAMLGTVLSVLVGMWERSLPFLAVAGLAFVAAIPTEGRWTKRAMDMRRTAAWRD
jgi:hypothetical protein